MSTKFILHVITLGIVLFCGMATHAGEEMKMPAQLEGIKKMAFMGDSLTDGSDFPEYVINTLNKHYPGNGFSFINAGIMGNRARDLVNRLDRDVLSQKPDLTLIFIGTNDQNDVPEIQFEAELLYLSRRLREHNSRVAFISLTGNTDPQKAAQLRKYSDISRKVAEAQGDMFIDAWTFFENRQNAGTQMYIAPGDSHHSLEGFRAMGRVILNALGLPEDKEMDLAIAPPANLITKWQESDPVTTEKGVAPEPSMATGWKDYAPQEWVAQRDWSLGPLVMRGAWFPLQAEVKGRVSFARATYNAAYEGVHEIQLGGAGVLMWVNGIKVYDMKNIFMRGTNGYHPNAARTPVWLKKGANEIAITSGAYAFVGVNPLQ